MSEEEIGDMMDILELINENEEKDKEIERLNNIINELEYYLKDTIENSGGRNSMPFWYSQVYMYLQELKEGKNESN